MPAQALLVLEDKDGSKALCHEAAMTAGFTVVFASSAEAALDLCKDSGPFDLVVADFALEDGNGRKEILPRLRAHSPSIRALVVSNSSLDQLLAADILPPEEFRPHRTVFLRKPQPVPVMTGKILGLFENSAAMPLPNERTAEAKPPDPFGGSRNGTVNSALAQAAGAA